MSDLLIYRARHTDAMRELIARQRAGALALNADTDINPGDDAGVRFVAYRDALPPDRLSEIGRSSLQLAQTWYRPGDTDRTTAFGVSYGRYIEYEMKRVFVGVCRHLAYLRAVNPSRVLLADDGSLLAAVTLAFAQTSGIPVERAPSGAELSRPEWFPPAGAPVVSTGSRIKQLLRDGAWLPRKRTAGDGLTIFVWPHPYAATLVEAVVRSSRHRVVFPFSDSTTRWRRRVVVADWRLARHGTGPLMSAADSWHVVDDVVVRSGMSYEGVPLWPFMRAVARSFWDRGWTTFCHQAQYYGRQFEELGVDAVVVPQDQAGLAKLAVLIARQRDALTVCIEHGIESRRPTGFPPNNSDMLAVYGDECRRRVEADSGAVVVVIGNDQLHAMSRTVAGVDRAALRNRLGISWTTPVVLFAAGTFVNIAPGDQPADANEVLASVCRVARDLRDAAVLLRFHPSTAAYESVEVKRAIVDRFNTGNLYVDPGLAPSEALAVSDIVVTVDSTFGIEAIAAKRPFVTFDPARADIVGYITGGAGPFAHDEAGLLHVLKQLCADPERRSEAIAQGQRFLPRRVFGFGDGRAGRRLLAVIESARTARGVVDPLRAR